MSDKTQVASDFSFRTFDIYRRFIEVLQCNPAYLKEFKIGSPKLQTCLALIECVFQSQQKKEEIKRYIEYFANHAIMMAGHAENLPDNWNDAIEYTNKYINTIYDYLQKKGISIKANLNSVNKIAKDIGKSIHGNPSVKQVEAIRYYLKHDLFNPKRNISLNTSKKLKNKSKGPSENFKKSKTINDKRVSEEKEIIYVQEETDKLSIPCESVQEVQLFEEINKEIDINNDETIQFEHIETEIVGDLFETTDLNVLEYQIGTDDTDYNFNVEENLIESELRASNNYEITGTERVEKTGKIKQSSEIDTASSSSEFRNQNNDKYLSYKCDINRKSSNVHETKYYCSLKKHLQLCNYNSTSHNILHHQKHNIFSNKTVCIKSNTDNSYDSEVNVDNDDEGDIVVKYVDTESSEQTKRDLFDGSLKLQAKHMSYADAVKQIDLVSTFCQIKDAISQEDLDFMQQIRNKIYLKSLNE